MVNVDFLIVCSGRDMNCVASEPLNNRNSLARQDIVGAQQNHLPKMMVTIELHASHKFVVGSESEFSHSS